MKTIQHSIFIAFRKGCRGFSVLDLNALTDAGVVFGYKRLTQSGEVWHVWEVVDIVLPGGSGE